MRKLRAKNQWCYGIFVHLNVSVVERILFTGVFTIWILYMEQRFSSEAARGAEVIESPHKVISVLAISTMRHTSLISIWGRDVRLGGLKHWWTTRRPSGFSIFSLVSFLPNAPWWGRFYKRKQIELLSKEGMGFENSRCAGIPNLDPWILVRHGYRFDGILVAIARDFVAFTTPHIHHHHFTNLDHNKFTLNYLTEASNTSGESNAILNISLRVGFTGGTVTRERIHRSTI